MTDIQSKSESRRLLNAYRFAKAQRDIRIYDPANDGDLADEIDTPLSIAHGEAMEAYLLYPVDDLGALKMKLEVFRDEEIAGSWSRAQEIAAVLAGDAVRALYASATTGRSTSK